MKIDIDFLWWLRNVMFYRDDAREELMEAGADRGLAVYLTLSDAFRDGDVVEFLHHLHETDETIYNNYLATRRKQYDQIVQNKINQPS